MSVEPTPRELGMIQLRTRVVFLKREKIGNGYVQDIFP